MQNCRANNRGQQLDTLLRRTRELSSADLNRAAFRYNCSNDYSLHPSVCIGQMDVVCEYCGALKFSGETPGLCCFSGKVKLPLLTPPPEPMFKSALERMPNDDYKVVIKADKRPSGTHERTFNTPTIDEVTILIAGEQLETSDIVLTRCDTGQLQQISETHRSYEALQYPLRFWQGEDGYYFNIKMINPLNENDTHWDTTIAEAIISASPSHIRTLFAIIISTCFPSNPWHKYKDNMSEDILHQIRVSSRNHDIEMNEEIRNRALLLIGDMSYLMCGSLLIRLGMPGPNREMNNAFSRELEREREYVITTGIRFSSSNECTPVDFPTKESL
ncbi:putative DNA helicase [Trichonephila inaurata madagascariensis]|uniref:Putative DNA helicase n=1 Tax=Trichonephila inaurata madagascariensis TaxID=2747483 RepID=A0A8X6WS76_9ARAC|nr:putative DNA helicase [Trichonephila inaurata madagascariensis]